MSEHRCKTCKYWKSTNDYREWEYDGDSYKPCTWAQENMAFPFWRPDLHLAHTTEAKDGADCKVWKSKEPSRD